MEFSNIQHHIAFQLNVDRSKLEGPSDLIVYFSLPESHKGQQLTSYGGYLRYKIKYSSTVAGQDIKGPDVIMVVGWTENKIYSLSHLFHS